MTVHTLSVAVGQLAEHVSAAILWSALAASLLPLLVVEVLAALLYRRTSKVEPLPVRWPKTVVLVPAHNEAGLVGNALRSITEDLQPNTCVLCVAHNCTDDTASIARAAGVEGLEAVDDGSCGKQWGWQALRRSTRTRRTSW